MSIQNYLNQIKNAIFGKEIREAIYNAIKQCYDDAATNHDNANMEVKLARGDHNTLNDRFNSAEESIRENTTHISHKAEKADLEAQGKRIENIIANNNPSEGNSELIDIRVGQSGKKYTSAGEAIRAISKGKELNQKVFSSCFIQDTPSYKVSNTETVIDLKNYIIDIEIENADENIIVTVGMINRQDNLNRIGLYKCDSSGNPDGTEGIVFDVKITNEEQILEAKGILNGVATKARIMVKNWANMYKHDYRGINYNIGGISSKCFIRTQYNNLATKHSINKINNNDNFINCPYLEDLVEDIELIGFDTSMKMSLSMVRKNYTYGGTIKVQNKVGFYKTLDNGEADPSKGIIIDIEPEKANEVVKKHIRTTFEGKEVEIKITLNWFKIIEDDFNKQGISNFSVAGINFKNYKQSYNGVASKEANFNNCNFLEELIEDIELIGFNKEDKIILAMVRRNYTKGGTTALQNKIGLYKIDSSTGQANPNKGLFIDLPEEIKYDAPIVKHIKTKFDGADVEIKISINWFKLKNIKELDANGIYNLGYFNVAGVKFKNYIEKIDETNKSNFLTLSKNYIEKPIIVFVDDDGSKAFLTKSKPIFDKYGVKCSLGIVTKNATNGSSTNLQTEDLKVLQAEGYDILSHSHTHDAKLYKPGYVTETDEAIEADIKASYEYIKNNGFGTNAIVYPWGEYPDKNKYISLAQKYFEYGINAGAGGSSSVVMTDNVLESMYYRRRFINDSISIESYKSLIDGTLNTNGWLIFGMHSGISGEFSSERLDEIIAYIKEKGIDILTFSEANKIKQNICSIGTFGEKGKSLYIGRTGVILN